ncbi:hypothetical protein PG984_006813 [Apiospora sp. TS-2023a]
MFLPRLTLRNRFDKILNGHADHHHTNRKKRCAKKKCKERSEWSYVRGSSANLDVSPYCAAHACPWREANGISCRHSKKSNKLYCKYHLVCQAAPYGTQCSADRSNPLSRDCKFCELREHSPSHHPPSWAACNNEILPPQGRKTFTYCKDHSCQQPDCAEARIGATGTRQSMYCVAHTCKDPHCMANVSAAPEVGDTKGQHMYCPVHRPCRHADCNSMVHRVSNAEYRKHCSNHYCEFGNNCDEPRAAGVKVCGSHRCRRSGCAKMLQNAVGRYCEDHECKDTTGPCLEERVDHSEWCTRHICRDYHDNCKNQGDPNKMGFCVDHVRCEEQGCDNKILIDKGVRRQKCEDHHFGICEYTGCLKPIAHNNGHKHHCADHACLAHAECGYARIGIFQYCTRHKCSVLDCGTLRAQASSLTPAMLVQLRAASLAPSGSNFTAADLNMCDPWCEAHRCFDKGCSAQAVAAGGSALPTSAASRTARIGLCRIMGIATSTAAASAGASGRRSMRITTIATITGTPATTATLAPSTRTTMAARRTTAWIRDLAAGRWRRLGGLARLGWRGRDRGRAGEVGGRGRGPGRGPGPRLLSRRRAG